jgi:hypothetical protein
MADTDRRIMAVDPIHRLALRPFCDAPDVENLTLEQRYALHEFFHQVMAAGYKLYQVVPAQLAVPVLKKKFQMMVQIPTDSADQDQSR